jgi:hypothetical protein
VERAGSAVSSGRCRRRAARRTLRSVSIAPPKAGRGTECARPGALDARRLRRRVRDRYPNGRGRGEYMTRHRKQERLRARRA